MKSGIPEIRLELCSGIFRIKTSEADYLIEVNPNGSWNPLPANNIQQISGSNDHKTLPQSIESTDEDGFFQEISEEMFSKVGALARELSLSLQDIPNDAIAPIDLEGSGVKLEDAKAQLEDIVQMTEKATMDIMDLTESILEDCQSTFKDLENIRGMDFMSDDEAAAGETEVDLDVSTEDPDPVIDLLESIIERQKDLKIKVNNIPIIGEEPDVQEPVEPEPEVRMVKVYSFDQGALFQIMYELCTNETVKSHIKAMGDNHEANFNPTVLKSSLAEMAPNMVSDENFYDFPLDSILKSLYQHSTNEKFKQVLKKMGQTISSIFLDDTLPLEGEVEEKEITIQPESFEIKDLEPASANSKYGVSPEDVEEITSRIQENIDLIEKEKAGLLDNSNRDIKNLSGNSSLTMIKKEDRSTIVSVVEHSHQNLEAIIAHITRILEALSFQDLSGQRIMVIVRLISHVQIQLLSILVSFGTKLKKRNEVKNVTSSEREEMVQAEVDQMMERISTPLEGPTAQNSLNQKTVDTMLNEMGF